MKRYQQMIEDVLYLGEDRKDRTGTGTISVFGYQARFGLCKGFPLLTTKRVFWKGVIHELLWMLSGDTNIKYLNDHGVHIWDEWENHYGELGLVYGWQWGHWGADGKHERGIDQIIELIDGLKKNPQSRRHIVSAWNVAELDYMALPPCHVLFQMYVSTDGGLSCHLYQRSADVFLGVPFNIASYALLTHMVAHVCGLYPKELIISYGDLHLYKHHIEQTQEQLSREPKTLPTLSLRKDIDDIFKFKFEDITLSGYDPHPSIKGDVSV